MAENVSQTNMPSKLLGREFVQLRVQRIPTGTDSRISSVHFSRKPRNFDAGLDVQGEDETLTYCGWRYVVTHVVTVTH